MQCQTEMKISIWLPACLLERPDESCPMIGGAPILSNALVSRSISKGNGSLGLVFSQSALPVEIYVLLLNPSQSLRSMMLMLLKLWRSSRSSTKSSSFPIVPEKVLLCNAVPAHCEATYGQLFRWWAPSWKVQPAVIISIVWKIHLSHCLGT